VAEEPVRPDRRQQAVAEERRQGPDVARAAKAEQQARAVAVRALPYLVLP
jgi:hypothetical protein